MKKVEAEIRERLQGLEPLHLNIINESDQHSGPPGRESHFRVVIASPQFDGASRVKRHRMVQAPLKHLFDQGLHALAIETQTSEEFTKLGGQSFESPACKGGGK